MKKNIYLWVACCILLFSEITECQNLNDEQQPNAVLAAARQEREFLAKIKDGSFGSWHRTESVENGHISIGFDFQTKGKLPQYTLSLGCRDGATSLSHALIYLERKGKAFERGQTYVVLLSGPKRNGSDAYIMDWLAVENDLAGPRDVDVLRLLKIIGTINGYMELSIDHDHLIIPVDQLKALGFASSCTGSQNLSAPTSVAEVEKLIKAGNDGNVDAQIRLGIAYGTGDVVPKDLCESAKWFRMARAKGEKGMTYLKNHGLGRCPVER
jgi:hypothetical protein